jgi:putative ABC transport system permease protein
MGWLDRWREILQILWRRKLRTALTALSVAWGIFMLVVLLAAGEGLSNGAQAEFGRDALNSVWVSAGRLSKPYRGNPLGKSVALDNEDYELATGVLPIIEHASARLGLPPQIVRRGTYHGGFGVRGTLPDNDIIEKSLVTAGRFLNQVDQRQRRKVAAIGIRVKEAMFPAGEDPIGATIEIGRTAFTVVGVFEEEEEQSEQETIYVPLSTAQLVWGRASRIDQFQFTVGQATAAQAETAVVHLRELLSARHGFAPDDRQALRVWNSQEMYERFVGLFRGIRTFVWLIGLGTIFAGVVGVSNIMLISVQERTREIGIRKAVGAPPSSIVAMVLQEALVITLVSGYLGLVAGVGTIFTVQAALPPTPYFRQPDVDLSVGLAATAVLVVAGVVAGLFPALRAARINPIAALRVE